MPDLSALGIDAIARQSPYAPALLMAAGVLTSLGPCTAPRMLAVAGFSGTNRRYSRALCIAYVGGILTGYAAFATAGALLVDALGFSNLVYGVFGVVLAGVGLTSLLRSPKHVECATHRPSISSGGVFLCGAASALVISPCCMPVLGAIVAYGGATGNPLFTVGCILSFGIGHAIPILLVGAGADVLTSLAPGADLQQAVSTISAALTVALGAFYMVLA